MFETKLAALLLEFGYTGYALVADKPDSIDVFVDNMDADDLLFGAYCLFASVFEPDIPTLN